VLEDPGEERGGGGLAVRAGDDEVVGLAQEVGLHRLGQREIEPLRVERRLEFRVAAFDRVADDEDGILRGQVLRLETGLDGNALFGKKSRHRRVDALIRAGDGVAFVAQHRRDRAHGGSADTQKVKRARRRLNRRGS